MAKANNISTRRSILTKGAAVAALTATAGVTSAKAAKPVFAPTELGREFMRQIPIYVRAWSLTIAYDNKDPTALADSDAERGRLEALQEAMIDRPMTSPAHLVDLAIADRCFAEWEYVDPAHEAMTLALLKLAGISEADCKIDDDDLEKYKHPEVARIEKARESVKVEAERIMADAQAKVAALEHAALA